MADVSAHKSSSVPDFACGLCAETSAIYINHQHLRGFNTKENYRVNARFDYIHVQCNQLSALVASGAKTSRASSIDVAGTPPELLVEIFVEVNQYGNLLMEAIELK